MNNKKGIYSEEVILKTQKICLMNNIKGKQKAEGSSFNTKCNLLPLITFGSLKGIY